MNWSKIITRTLKENIQIESIFKPFNDKYDNEKVQTYAKEAKVVLTTEEKQLLDVMPQFNHVYVDYYAYLKKFQNVYKFSPSIVNQYLLSLANRDYVTYLEVCKHHFDGKDYLHAENVGSITVETVFGDSLLGVGAMETSIDIIDCIMSYYRYFPDEKDPGMEFDSLEIKDLYAMTSKYIVIKGIFDKIVWEGAYLKPSDKNKGEYIVLYPADYSIKKKVGLQRTMRFMEEEPLGDPMILEYARGIYQKKKQV